MPVGTSTNRVGAGAVGDGRELGADAGVVAGERDLDACHRRQLVRIRDGAPRHASRVARRGGSEVLHRLRVARVAGRGEVAHPALREDRPDRRGVAEETPPAVSAWRIALRGSRKDGLSGVRRMPFVKSWRTCWTPVVAPWAAISAWRSCHIVCAQISPSA